MGQINAHKIRKITQTKHGTQASTIATGDLEMKTIKQLSALKSKE